ncbi:Protein of unknown function DUF58 [Jatrophihabitans endophyticus]|uniref:Uncharacterized protein n=1 Tax=Jatrophihabitans endophyticus TaxID=1206085 RepID=A0A1M5PCP5_9ACTN|nr:DUF58 domain-containing protein [Jatrophihabitans endophyticus]SHG99540.1 Protein of unknown function DUF58 [Jatrophihabitans endophyticus]
MTAAPEPHRSPLRRGRELAAAARPVVGAVQPVLGTVSPLGWTVLALGVAGWIVGWLLGWAEIVVVALACLSTVVLCALLTIGRTRLSVRLELTPRRVVAGSPAAGRLVVSNSSRARLLPLLLELPIGVSRAQFPLRRLRMGEVQEELFSLATTRRGVVPVGPATTVRGDPFGLLRRSVPWSEVIELMVHPRTVALESLGAGVLRDLEGQTTNEVSTSDLAFHTLREYEPGDDRRYVHWRSSARASALSGEDRLLVRQFLDTRRSHLCTIVDGRSAPYLDEVDFETAISVAASAVRRAYEDDVDTTVLAAQSVFNAADAGAALAMDAFSRAELGQGTALSTMARHAAQIAPGTTVAMLVTGARTEFGELRRAALHFAPEVNVVAVRVDPTEPAGITAFGSLVVLSLPQLSGLRALLLASVAA